MGLTLTDPRPSGSMRLRLAWATILTILVLLLAHTHEGPSGDVPERILDAQAEAR